MRACRLRLHFDGYPDNHDFWVNCDSPNLFPTGWCDKNGKALQPAKDGASSSSSSSSFILAPKALFPHLRRERGEKALPMGFRIGMKLEALDPLSAEKDVCVATVRDILPSDNRFGGSKTENERREHNMRLRTPCMRMCMRRDKAVAINFF